MHLLPPAREGFCQLVCAMAKRKAGDAKSDALSDLRARRDNKNPYKGGRMSPLGVVTGGFFRLG